MRRFGDPVRPGVRYTRRAGVYAILRLGSDVLLTHQMAPWPEFQLPGGGVDAGEHPVRALHREVLEETGWSIGPARRLSVHRRFTFMPEYDLWAEKVCTVYLARPVCRRGPPSEAGHTAVWMPMDVAVDTVASPGDRDAIAAAMGLVRAARIEPRAALFRSGMPG